MFRSAIVCTFLCVVLLAPVSVGAASTSRFVGSAADAGDSSTAWTNPSNAIGDTTGTAATSELQGNGTVSNTLRLTNFGFSSSIPENATIDGVLVEVEWQGGDSSIVDSLVQLTKDGTSGVGEDKGRDSAQTSKALASYGGSSDTWGASFSRGDVVASSFGVLLAYTKASGGPQQTADVFRVRVTVSYTPPPACNDGTDNDGDGETDYPEDDGCSSASDDDESDTQSSSGDDDGDSGGGDVSTGTGTGVRRVTFSGQAYPDAQIDVLQKSTADDQFAIIPEPDRSYTLNADGTFEIIYEGLIGGEYFFALRAIDSAGRETGIRSFGTNLVGYNLQTSRFEAANLLIPPTLGFQKSVVSRGEGVVFEGSAAPGAMVAVTVDSELFATTTADTTTGGWRVMADSLEFGAGVHHAQARQMLPDGGESVMSRSRTFKISQLLFPQADFTNDSRITIADWSIFLSRWNATSTQERASADLNDDGDITIVDLSIFLDAMRAAGD